MVLKFETVKQDYDIKGIFEIDSDGNEIIFRPEDHDIIDKSNSNLGICPECGKQTLRMEGGCNTCINKECGFSKCDV